MNAKTREEHLQWCKDRALAYWRDGNLQDACASMVSDLGKHEDTKIYNTHSVRALGTMFARLGDAAELRHWIEGFR